jgi:hypothetical protein
MTSHYLRAIQVSLYALGFILLVSLGMVGEVSAVTTCAANTSPSVNCTDLNLNNAGSITINSGVSVTNLLANEAVQNTGATTSIVNSGSITAITSAPNTPGSGIYNNSSSTIGTLTNIGTISGTSSGTISANGQDGYGVFNNGAITNLTNSGTINGAGGYDASGIWNNGTITTLTNNLSSTISGGVSAISNNASSLIGTITNNGTLSSNYYTIVNYGSDASHLANIGTINNNGTITITGSIFQQTIYNGFGTIGTINNNLGAVISGNDLTGYFGAQTIFNDVGGTISNINNSGTISSINTFGGSNQAVSIYNASGYTGAAPGVIETINNSSTGLISATGAAANPAYAILNGTGASITNVINAGTLTASAPGFYAYGIYNQGSIGAISNNGGVIGATGSTAYGINNESGATISTITNTGTISGTTAGIFNNAGTISTLNNSQGSAGALTYKGALPANYNVIITSPTSYGKLSVSSSAGSTTFGISSSSNRLNATSYSSVLTGITLDKLNNTTGTFLGTNWSLINSAGTTWDLLFSSVPIYGPSTADTQQSLVNTANALAPVYAMQNAVVINSFTYDCTLFDVNNICISAGGRNTAVSAANGLNNTSALLIAAYRPHPNYRIGAYADQNLSVSNAGSTVNLSNNTPLLGLFGAWNERLDGTGTEVKLSAAYGQKNTTITRQVVGTSEPGSGSSQLNSQGAQVMAKYGFGLADSIIVSPYVGVRYTQNNMGGYTEGASSTVTAPLTYSALNTNATTALAGLGTSYKVIPTVTTFASAGVETDTNTSNGSYSATGVSGLTPVNFNPNPVRTRPTAMVGAYYDIVKNQRLGVTGIYRQEAYQAVATTTVMATYTIGL